MALRKTCHTRSRVKVVFHYVSLYVALVGWRHGKTGHTCNGRITFIRVGSPCEPLVDQAASNTCHTGNREMSIQSESLHVSSGAQSERMSFHSRNLYLN